MLRKAYSSDVSILENKQTIHDEEETESKNKGAKYSSTWLNIPAAWDRCGMFSFTLAANGNFWTPATPASS